MSNTKSLPIIAVAFAIAAGYVGGLTEDTRPTRAVMFVIVAAIFAGELASMVGRTRGDQWDGLAITMAAVRFGIVHYFASMALTFGGYADPPEWYWTIARTLLGVTGGAAFAYMAREDLQAFREMTRRQRCYALVGIAIAVALYGGVAVIW